MEPTQTGATPSSVSGQTPETQATVSSKSVSRGQKSKGFIFGVIVCVVLAIAGIAFGAYGMVLSREKTDELANLKIQIEDQNGAITILNTDEIKISDDKGTITITDSMRDDGKVRAIVDEMQKIAAETNGVSGIRVYDWNFPLVKVQNAKTLLPIEKSYGLYAFDELDDISESSAMAEAITKRLKELGFKDNDDITGPPFVTGGTNLIDPDSGIVCGISDGLPFFAECGHISWISDETIALANKLSDAYFIVENSYPLSINLRKYTIKDSIISPYQTLMTPVANAMGLFYRTSSDADWQYFTATQAELDCSDFNTQDLKNAFAGEICYNGSQDSTVQP